MSPTERCTMLIICRQNLYRGVYYSHFYNTELGADQDFIKPSTNPNATKSLAGRQFFFSIQHFVNNERRLQAVLMEFKIL